MNQSDQDNEHKLVVGKPYVFCPWCGAKLIEAVIDGRTRNRCPDCDFVHYRNPIPAAGAIIENNGSILLVKRKYPPYVGDWCFPAGFMEYGESPERCCIRELKEETGLDVKLRQCFRVYAGNDDPRSKAVLILYLVESYTGELNPGDDASETRYFAENELPNNIAFKSHRLAIKDYYDFKRTGEMPKSHG